MHFNISMHWLSTAVWSISAHTLRCSCSMWQSVHHPCSFWIYHWSLLKIWRWSWVMLTLALSHAQMWQSVHHPYAHLIKANTLPNRRWSWVMLTLALESCSNVTACTPPICSSWKSKCCAKPTVPMSHALSTPFCTATVRSTRSSRRRGHKSCGRQWSASFQVE